MVGGDDIVVVVVDVAVDVAVDNGGGEDGCAATH